MPYPVNWYLDKKKFKNANITSCNDKSEKALNWLDNSSLKSYTLGWLVSISSK